MTDSVLQNEKQQVKDLGEFLAQRRYLLGKTQRELADEMKIGQARVTDLEKALVDFKFSTLQRFARVFGYRVEIHFVNDETGEDLIAVPDPTLRKERTYEKATGPKKPRKQSPRKPRSDGPVPQKVLTKHRVRTLDDADFDRGMQDMRASIWGK